MTLSDETQSQIITGAARAVLSAQAGIPRAVIAQQPRMGAGGSARRGQAAAAATGTRSDDTVSVISEISTLRWDMNGNPNN